MMQSSPCHVVRSIALACCLLAMTAAHAQIFVTSDQTIETDVGFGNGVLVGKDNATSFTTLPGTVTLTVKPGAVLFGGSIIHGNYYQGVHVFGSHRTDIEGGQIAYVTAWNSSAVDMSGGSVTGYLGGAGSATITIRGGTVHAVTTANACVVNITGGNVTDIYAANSSIINLKGGTMGTNTIRLLDDGVLNIYGTGLALAMTGTGTDFDGHYTGYMLSGTLNDGRSIDGVTLRDYDGGLSVGNPGSGGGNLHFLGGTLVAPEPGSLALLAALALPAAVGWRRARVSHD